jgi:hypothetical protein
MADVAEARAVAHLLDAQPHAFVGDLGQALGQDRRLADHEHAAGVAVVAFLGDHGDVEFTTSPFLSTRRPECRGRSRR